MSAMRPEEVTISDPGFFIANVMKDCPARTVIRELLQNAIEASGVGRIEWFRHDYNGTPKLGLYNEGSGMDHRELSERMNIASSGKELGFDKNYGQGAKMSAGKASPYGLIYRSCKSGDVSEIWLQLQDRPGGGRVLVKMPQFDEYDNEEVVVRQVTDDAIERGRKINVDWTEAILLGRSADDNTIKGDFLGESSVLWLSKLINQRYYCFPEGVAIRHATITTDRAEAHRNARGLAASLAAPSITERMESITANHPRFGDVSIVYGRLAGKSKDRRGGPLTADGLPGGSHVCLVWRNEVYDFDPKWFYQGGAYGFPGAAHDYYIQIILSEVAPVENTNHRTEIITGDAERVASLMFCNLVREHRPQWILDDLQKREQDNPDGKLLDRIRKMAESLKAWMDTPVISPDDGNSPGVLEYGPGDGNSGGENAVDRTPTRGGRTTIRGVGRPRNDRPRPETLTARFQTTEAVEWYEGMKGQAGQYDEGSNVIWLSEEFSDFQRLSLWVNETWPTSEEHALARNVLREEYILHAVSLGIAAISFRGDKSWSPDQWRNGLSPEAISCYMRDPAGKVRSDISRKVNSKLKQHIREQAETTNA